MDLMCSVIAGSPSASICCGELATANKRRVALFTPTSVAWADSSTAANSSKTLVYSSSEVGCGLAAFSTAKNGAMWADFMTRDCP